MQTIKNFIYLDEYKMYSISSQIFEGITESLTSYKETTTEESEEQKGPVRSGKVVADILKFESGTQEKKYLHDYAYKLFEEELSESGKILSISAKSINEKIEQISTADFVKVKGKVIFNDMNIIKSTLSNFNQMGEALAYITNFSHMEEVRQQFEKAAENTKDRNQKAKLRQKLKSMTNIEKVAKDQGLWQDPDFLEKLAFVLDYGFQDQFTVQMSMGSYTFSADCKRDAFREKEHSLMRKYSRFSEKEFVLVGTVAQSSREPFDRHDDTDVPTEPPHMKEAIMNMVEALFEIESTFSGKLANEIIIDPIAIYRKI